MGWEFLQDNLLISIHAPRVGGDSKSVQKFLPPLRKRDKTNFFSESFLMRIQAKMHSSPKFESHNERIRRLFR